MKASKGFTLDQSEVEDLIKEKYEAQEGRKVEMLKFIFSDFYR